LKARTRTYALSAAIIASLLAVPATAQNDDERRLEFYHTHTGQRLATTFSRDGKYVQASLDETERFLGDFRTGDSLPIDPALLDLLFDIRELLGGRGTYEVISAYRSPATNEMLRGNGSGVAKDSLHLKGQAIDVRLTGVAVERLRDAAIGMQRGGVGYWAQ
jgi:uncharacterized protein YcbK (DUF882 family)